MAFWHPSVWRIGLERLRENRRAIVKWFAIAKVLDRQERGRVKAGKRDYLPKLY
jgi:hypothetical protein